jgi:dTDP-4-dehydrorhamnose 3,5-epimerase-like enzyme
VPRAETTTSFARKTTPDGKLGAYNVDLEPDGEERGFLARAVCQGEFEARGVKPLIAQTNISFKRR